jgi:hypothetical protein
MVVGGQRHAPVALPPGNRAGTHCTGRDGCGKSRLHWDSIPTCTDYAIPAYMFVSSLSSWYKFILHNSMIVNLWFVSPCIIIYSNKWTNQMHQSLRFIVCRLNTTQHVSGILMPIIRSLSTAVAASGFTYCHKIYCFVNLQLRKGKRYCFTIFLQLSFKLIKSFCYIYGCNYLKYMYR